MAKKILSRLSPAELEIMNLVWQKGEITINETLGHINALRANPLQRSTMQVQIMRLENKGWLIRRQDGHRLFFRPTRQREETVPSLVEDLARRAFNGSCTELVRCMFTQKKVSRDDLRQLRALIDKAERGDL